MKCIYLTLCFFITPTWQSPFPGKIFVEQLNDVVRTNLADTTKNYWFISLNWAQQSYFCGSLESSLSQFLYWLFYTFFVPFRFVYVYEMLRCSKYIHSTIDFLSYYRDNTIYYPHISYAKFTYSPLFDPIPCLPSVI